MNSPSRCKICNTETYDCFDALILSKYNTKLTQCLNCGFLCFDSPVWLDEAYADSIVPSDTGLVMRNLSLSEKLAPLFFYVFGSEGVYADFAGGTGLLVRLMRDIGFDFYWHDPYCRNVHARGFEYSVERSPYNAVTAFEVLEHVPDPLSFVEDSFRHTQAGMMAFSTELYYGASPTEDWWYYSLDTGQHISFFQKRTLQLIANKLNLDFYTSGTLHFFYQKQYAKPLKRYFNSKLVQRISAYKARRNLASRAKPDSLQLLSRIKSVEKKV